MNKTHRTVWSDARQSFVVTHEKAATRGKPSSVRRAVAHTAVISVLAAMGASQAATITIDSNNSQTTTYTLSNDDTLEVASDGSVAASSGNGVDVVGTAGNISNAGEISGTTGVLLDSGTTMSGGLTNSGTISSSDSAGIRVNRAQLTTVNNDGGTIFGGVRGIALAHGTITDNLTNSGSIGGATGGVMIYSGSTIAGGLTNSGTISSNTGIGIKMDGGLISNGLTNSGTIAGGQKGIYLMANSTISGGLINSGTIAGGAASISVDGMAGISDIIIAGNNTARFVGKVDAANTAMSIASDATYTLRSDDDFRVASFTNNGTAQFDGTTPSFSVANVGDQTFHNAGTLKVADGQTGTLAGNYDQSGVLSIGASSASSYGKLAVTGNATLNTGASFNVDVTGGLLTGGNTLTGVLTAGGTLTNNAGALSVTDNSVLVDFIAGQHGNAMDLCVVAQGATTCGPFVRTISGTNSQSSTFNLSNGDSLFVASDGSIASSSGHGVSVTGTAGFISNSGSIGGYSMGIFASNGTLTGSLINTGTIHGRFLRGITLVQETLSGGITNSGSIDGYDGIFVNVSGISGLTNAGSIVGTSSAGIHLRSSSGISQGLTNSGSIHGGRVGIYVSWTPLGAGLTNSGVISGGAEEGLLNGDNGSLSGQFAIAVRGGGVNNIVIEGDNTAGFNGAVYAPGAAVSIASGATYTLRSTDDFRVASFTNNGIAQFDGITPSFSVANVGDQTFHNAGTLKVADGQTGTITGNYDQSGVLSIGASGASSYGKLNVTGNATLNSGASFDVDVTGNALAGGNTLTGVLTAGTLTNNASTLSVTDNSVLVDFIAGQHGNAVDLCVVAQGATTCGPFIRTITGANPQSSTFNLSYGDSLVVASGGRIAVSTGNGVRVTGTADSISNSGSIYGNAGAVLLTQSTLQSGLTSSGTINGGGSWVGIKAVVSTINNGLTNSGNVYGGNSVFFDRSVLNGGFTNSGYIRASGATGILIRSSNFSGGLTNSGTIEGPTRSIYTYRSSLDNIFIAGNNTARFIGKVDAANTAVSIASDATYTLRSTDDFRVASFTNNGTAQFDSTTPSFTVANVVGQTFHNAGTLKVADGQTATLTGNYDQSGVLSIGASSDSSYGKLSVTGNATINNGASFNVDVTGNALAGGNTLSGVLTAGGTLTNNAGSLSVTDNSVLVDFIAGQHGNAVDLCVVAQGATTCGPFARTINGTNSQSSTFNLSNGDSLVVASDGSIATSSANGVSVTGTAGFIRNSGSISGMATGINVSNGTFSGSLTNSGTIAGGTASIFVDGTSTLGDIVIAGNDTARFIGKIDATNTAMSIASGASYTLRSTDDFRVASFTNNGTAQFDSITPSFSVANVGDQTFHNTGTLKVADGQSATLTGNYDQSGVLSIGASSASSYGKLSVTGNATLNTGASFNVDVTGNALAGGNTLTGVLTAGGTLTNNAGALSVTDNSVLVDFIAGQHGNAVDLCVVAQGATTCGPFARTINGTNSQSSTFNLSNGDSLVVASDGSIATSSSNGISVTGTAEFIRNSGSISAAATGINVSNGTFSGGLTNSGTIAGGTASIFVDGTSTLGDIVIAGSNTARFVGKVDATNTAMSIASGASYTLRSTDDFRVASFTNNGIAQFDGITPSFSVANVGDQTFHNAGTLKVADGQTGTITGNYAQSGVLSVGASSASSYGKLSVTGNATLNAGASFTVDVTGTALASGNTLSGVLTAGGTLTNNAGTLAVTDNSTLVDFVARAGAQTVDLCAVAQGATNCGTTSGGTTPGGTTSGGSTSGGSTSGGSTSGSSTTSTAFTAYVQEGGLSGAVAAAGTLDNLLSRWLANGTTGNAGMDTAITNLIAHSSATKEQVVEAVKQTLPVMVGGTSAVAGTVLGSINKVVQARMDGNRGMSSGDSFFTDRHLWFKPFASTADQDNKSGINGYKSNLAGAAFGGDALVGDNTRLGAAVAYASADVKSNNGGANRAKVDVYQLIGYGSHSLDANTELSFQADMGSNINRGTRNLAFMGTTARSSYRSTSYHLGVGIGRTYALSEATSVTPSIRADYTHIRDGGYSENGAGALSLNVSARTTTEMLWSADVKLAHKLKDGLTLVANGGVAYDSNAKAASVTAAYAGAPGMGFTTTGIKPDATTFRGGLGLVSTPENGPEITGRYDVEHRNGYTNQTVSAKARWMF